MQYLISLALQVYALLQKPHGHLLTAEYLHSYFYRMDTKGRARTS